MESVNETLEKILHFLSILQHACDRKRFLIEQHNSKCRNLFLKEWKSEQKRIEKDTEAEQKLKTNVEEKKSEDELLEKEDLEVISFADALLEKARVIRNKNKMLNKQVSKLDDTLPFKTSVDLAKSNVTTLKNNPKDLLNTTKKNNNTLPHSRSTPGPNLYKTSMMTHSKSLCGIGPKREVSVPNGNPRKAKTLDSNKVLKKPDVGYLSDKLYKELKCLSLVQNHTDIQQKDGKSDSPKHNSVSNSDSPQKAIQYPILSYQVFQSHLKSLLESKSHFQLQKDGFWYPFITLNNQKYLFEQTKCNTLGNFTKISKLLYRIQEIMLWIDLFSLLEKEILPYVKIIDESDKNGIRLCSYLSSLYHESLQRIPMLNID